MIAIGLLALTLFQDPGTAIPPEVQHLVRRLPVPTSTAPTIVTQFVRDTVAAGEKAELVTVVWFPTKLRDTLRHAPAVKQATFVGNIVPRDVHGLIKLPVEQPVGREPFDVYVSWQSVYPSGVDRVEAAPAALTYLVTSTNPMVPDSVISIRSLATSLVVQPARESPHTQR